MRTRATAYPTSRITDPAAARWSGTTQSPNGTTAGVAPWQQNLHYAEHINKDLFWNWVGKVDHNFTPNDQDLFPWGENQRNEVRNTTAIRSGPAQDGRLPLIRANRAMVGDWVRVFGGGAVFNVRGGYTYFLEWSQSQDALGFDSSRFGSSSGVVSQMRRPAIGGSFPASKSISSSACRGATPRTGTGTTRSSRTYRSPAAPITSEAVSTRGGSTPITRTTTTAAVSCSSTALSPAAP